MCYLPAFFSKVYAYVMEGWLLKTWIIQNWLKLYHIHSLFLLKFNMDGHKDILYTAGIVLSVEEISKKNNLFLWLKNTWVLNYNKT